MIHSRLETRNGRSPACWGGTALPRGWFAYSLGRWLNQLSWKLEQAIFLGHGGWGEVQDSDQEFKTRIRALFHDPVAAELETAVGSALEKWLAMVGSEDFVDSANETVRYYADLARRGASPRDVDAYFTDVTGVGMQTVEFIRSAILREVGPDDYLKRSFFLGETVDRGIRPTEEIKYECFDFCALNPAYWAVRRSANFAEDSFGYREEWRAYKQAMEMRIAEEDEDHPITLPRRPGRPSLPRRSRLVCRSYSCRRTALDLGWGPAVRIAWHALGMPGGPPRAIYAYHKRPDFHAFGSLLAQIDAAAMTGFSELEKNDETRLAAIRTPRSVLDDPVIGMADAASPQGQSDDPLRVRKSPSGKASKGENDRVVSLFLSGLPKSAGFQSTRMIASHLGIPFNSVSVTDAYRRHKDAYEAERFSDPRSLRTRQTGDSRFKGLADEPISTRPNSDKADQERLRDVLLKLVASEAHDVDKVILQDLIDLGNFEDERFSSFMTRVAIVVEQLKAEVNEVRDEETKENLFKSLENRELELVRAILAQSQDLEEDSLRRTRSDRF